MLGTPGTTEMEVTQETVVMLGTVEMQVILGTLGMLVPLGTLVTPGILGMLVLLGTLVTLGTPEILGTLETLEMLGTPKTLVTPRMYPVTVVMLVIPGNLVTPGTLGMPETLGMMVTLGPLVMPGTPGNPEGTLENPRGWAESGQALREQRGPGSSTHPQKSLSARDQGPMGGDTGRMDRDRRTHRDRLGTPTGIDWGHPDSWEQRDAQGSTRRCGDTWIHGDM